MPRRKSASPFAKRKPSSRTSSSVSLLSSSSSSLSSSASTKSLKEEEISDDLLLSAKPHLKLYKVFEDLEDPALREAREASANAAKVLQNAWTRRPKWPAAWAARRVDGFAKSLPESGHELSLRGRRRVADLGLHIRASLAYSETPPREFLRLLAIAARHRHAFEDEPERNRALDTRHSGGGFYDLGCGIGSLCLLAAIYHDFAGVVGVELLPELYEQGCLLMEDYYNYHMQARLVRKEPPAVVRFELGDFLTCHMVEPVPAVIFCHCVCFDQRRELSQSERDEIERNSDIDSSPSSSSVVSQS